MDKKRLDALHESILRALDHDESNETVDDSAKRLGIFLQEQLTELHYSPVRFAELLSIEPELASAVLDGLLPATELDNAFLEEIARVVLQPPGVLFSLLGRVAPPSN